MRVRWSISQAVTARSLTVTTGEKRSSATVEEGSTDTKTAAIAAPRVHRRIVRPDRIMRLCLPPVPTVAQPQEPATVPVIRPVEKPLRFTVRSKLVLGLTNVDEV